MLLLPTGIVEEIQATRRLTEESVQEEIIK